jgi:ParB-like chromosome segregation protein Spo0J
MTGTTTNGGRFVDPTSVLRAGGEHLVERVPLDEIEPGRTPRLGGENEEHVRALAESGADLPPIVVERSTMRVIDGMHRLRAARLRGDDTIAVRFLHCDEAEAFVRAVEANVAHGLPLSRQDRAAAAERIIDLYPQWSDRRLAAVCGLGPRAVAGIRSRRRPEAGEERVGRDGRIRPVNAMEGRRRAGQYLSEHPEASLREIARAAGISPTTARDVRNELATTGAADPAHEPPPADRPSRAAVIAADRADLRHLIDNLQRDPSLRYSERGRALLRWLQLRAVAPAEWEPLLDTVPTHCSFVLADVAHACAAEWEELAARMEERIGGDGG